VKHGISKRREGGKVRVFARVERRGDVAPQLVLTVSDTGAGANADELRRGRLLGVGLQNVERRLSCQYGASASLRITSQPNAGTTVEIRLPVRQATPADTGVSLEGAAR
jgi:two-component system sensor histidine kinase YesM